MDTKKAAITWSYIAEADDKAACLLISTLGEEAALAWVQSFKDLKNPDQISNRPCVLPAELADLVPAKGTRVQQEWHKKLSGWLTRLAKLNLDALMMHSDKLGIQALTRAEEEYPQQLRELELFPPVLWLWGDPKYLNSTKYHIIAVVGSRVNSRRGSNVTAEIIQGCKPDQTVILSGAAWGIDAVAHQAALASSIPTVAVLAGGLDRIYPLDHTQLINQIKQDYLVVSQYPIGSRPTRWRFLARNRLMASLAQAVLVVEAGIRSGSLNSAKHARDLDRYLGVVPGPVDEATWMGSNQLLYDGAQMIRNTRDLEEMILPLGKVESWRGQKPIGILDGMKPDEARVYDALPCSGTTSLESIVPACGLSTREVIGVLSRLLMGQKVVQVGDQWGRK